MKWKANINSTVRELELPPFTRDDEVFMLKLAGKVYEAKWQKRLQTLYLRQPGETLFRNFRVKRWSCSKNEGGSEYLVDFELSHPAFGPTMHYSGETWMYTPASEQRRQSQAAQGATLRSPMTGKILKVLVTNGSKVAKGDPILIIEAMKMENKILAPAAGFIEKFKVEIGTNINAGTLIAQIKPEKNS